ncbi:MAG TPA: rod shape-determining protein MreC [Acetobacteraceae bacterium]|jgi:rod shape-determining protein MreC|nr:rod shape-determining protein MreC [Acetobacteraceae bacterium]
MIHLSIPARQALAKFTLPVLIAASFCLMLLGKADALLADRARVAFADALAPIYAALAAPLGALRAGITETTNLWDLRADNAALRAQNQELRRWQAVALALDAENRRLKVELHWIPDPAPSYVTARVVADAGGVYARAVLVSVGPDHGIKRGEIALDSDGLVGRVTEVGSRSARILLITDLNSRIPVVLQGSGAHAIMVGTNGPYPRLMYWPEGSPPREGDHVVTGAETDAFPANLPIGVVHYTSARVPEVVPAAQLDRLEIVRIFNYGLTGLVDPEAGRPVADRRH